MIIHLYNSVDMESFLNLNLQCWVKVRFKGFVFKSWDGWWHGFQHGIGLIGQAAPIAFNHKLKSVYIVSTFTIKDKVTCASDPIIDNFVEFCGWKTIHDGYESTRQDKVHKISRFVKNTGVDVNLRVCWISSGKNGYFPRLGKG